MTEMLLTLEEFEALSDADQELYLDVIEKDENAWTLTGRQLIADALADEVTETLYGGAAGGGKALAIWTPIPTPDGWTYMGLLEPGDVVFGADGKPTEVAWVSDMRTDRPCYRVKFDDGEEIIADEDHQWFTWDYKTRAQLNRRGTGHGQVRTTKELAESVLHNGRTNHSIRVTEPLSQPDVQLDVAPYVLGAWLGDGSSAHGGFTTADPEILEEINREGYSTTKWGAKYAYGIDNLKAGLRSTGVLGQKHVPTSYLRASRESRLACLQGLMDTDGCVTESGGVEFTSTSRQLIEGAHELAISLGHKVTITEGRATLYGKDCGPKYRMKWSPHEIVFRLPRKADAQKVTQRGTQQWRYVVSVEPIDEQIPVKCIGVMNEDHLFLAGRHMVPTHNSEWILNRAWRKSREVPGHRTLILRTKLKELRRSIVARSVLLYAQHSPKDEMPRFKVADLEWHFPNGSVIEFGYCMTDEDVGQYLSAEYDMIAFDEATQFTQYQYELIRSRARSPISKIKKGARPHVIAATNPGSRGHAFFKGTFVDPTDRGDRGATYLERDEDDRWQAIHKPLEEYTEDEREEFRHIAFVPSTVADNPHMPREYIMSLKTLPEKERRRMLEGDWDLPEGMFFTEFRRSIDGVPYHVVPAFPIPDSWKKIEATDWGFANPFCTLWMAWDPDGRCYVYREVYASRLTVAQQANLVVSSRNPGEKIYRSYADPSCWAMRDTLNTADQWAKQGWRNVKAKNSRIDGWNRVRDYMSPMADGFPAVQIFDNCTNLIRTIPAMMHDDVNPEDLDTDLEDHAVDAFRYGLMTRPLPMSKDREGLKDRAARHFDRMTGRNKKKTNRIMM